MLHSAPLHCHRIYPVLMLDKQLWLVASISHLERKMYVFVWQGSQICRAVETWSVLICLVPRLISHNQLVPTQSPISPTLYVITNILINTTTMNHRWLIKSDCVYPCLSDCVCLSVPCRALAFCTTESSSVCLCMYMCMRVRVRVRVCVCVCLCFCARRGRCLCVWVP